VGGALVRIGHSLARVKIWGRSPPRGRNMVFRKMRLGYVNMSAYNFVRCGRNFTKKFFQRRKNRTCQRRLDFVAIFIGFKDIRSQTRKLS